MGARQSFSWKDRHDSDKVYALPLSRLLALDAVALGRMILALYAASAFPLPQPSLFMLCLALSCYCRTRRVMQPLEAHVLVLCVSHHEYVLQ